jgi:3-hydroxyisobutyrate dehydrogenase
MSGPRIGFIGLGAMGSALATRLAGQAELTVFDLDPARAEPLVAAGATAASDIGAMKAARIIITCLPTSADVRSALDALQSAGGPASGALIIDCTSGDPTATRDIEAGLTRRGIAFADAPVSGGPQAAAAGTIAVLVGADDVVFARAEPVLRLISPSIRHVGAVGSGHCVKLLNNALAAGQRLLAFEALTVAVGQGVDPVSFTDAVNVSSGRSYASEVTLPRHLLNGMLDQGFMVFEPFGLHHRIGYAPKRMAEQAKLAPASRAPLPFSAVHLLFPNTIIHVTTVGPGHATLIYRVFPGAQVGRSFTMVSTYRGGDVPRQEPPSAWEKLHDYQVRVVGSEDYRVAAAAQVNFEQAPATPRVVYGANELSIQRFETNVATLIEPSLRCRSRPHLNERGTDDSA